MPAPLAKGLIISLSILIAAGIAVYESPQVRQWVDESRRKIAIALHSLGDEIQPQRPDSRRSPSADASTREDESAEAVERRRRAREEILEKGRMMEERRRTKTGEKVRGMSFDSIVNGQGKLKPENTENEKASSTAAELNSAAEGLRNRNAEVRAMAMGSLIADPFADETGMDFSSQNTSADANTPVLHSRESTATIQPYLSPSPPHSRASTLQQSTPSLRISTSTSSSHPSDLLVDLTPTTSRAPSSDFHDDLSELNAETYPPSSPNSQQQVLNSLNYYSVNEWAENSSASFYSPPRSEMEVQGGDSDAEMAGLERGMEELVGMSEGGSEEGSWTDVGSVVSEED